MALEWVVLGYAAAAEAIMLLFLTLPGLNPIRNGLISVTRSLLKPFLSIVPFCLFLLLDIYWKYETRPSCEADSCSPSEHLRHQKSIMKSQRNALLIAAALIFYWLLYSVTGLVVRLDQLSKRLDKIKQPLLLLRVFCIITKVYLLNRHSWLILFFTVLSIVGGFFT